MSLIHPQLFSQVAQALHGLNSNVGADWEKLDIKFTLDLSTAAGGGYRSLLTSTRGNSFPLDLTQVLVDCNNFLSKIPEDASEFDINHIAWVFAIDSRNNQPVCAIPFINHILSCWWLESVLKDRFKYDISIQRNEFTITYDPEDISTIYPFILKGYFRFPGNIDWLYAGSYSDLITRLKNNTSSQNTILDFHLTILNPMINKTNTESKIKFTDTEDHSHKSGHDSSLDKLPYGRSVRELMFSGPEPVKEYYRIHSVDFGAFPPDDVLTRVQCNELLSILVNKDLKVGDTFTISALQQWDALREDMDTTLHILKVLCDEGLLTYHITKDM